MEKSYFTYVLLCADQTLYCGYTNDLSQRISAHNQGTGAKYTKARLPVKLLTSIKFDNKSDALKCEWWFKHRLNRAQKLRLIEKSELASVFYDYMQKRSH